MSVQYEPGTEGLTDSNHHLTAALEAVAEVARKLKEERDEAIAARKASAADWLNQIEQANIRLSRASQQVARAERERDEAREAWYEMHSSFERSRDEVEKLTRERDEARRFIAIGKSWDSKDSLLSETHKLTKERDEAREKFETLAVENMLEVHKLSKERDEARELAAKWEATALREASTNGARICGKEAAK